MRKGREGRRKGDKKKNERRRKLSCGLEYGRGGERKNKEEKELDERKMSSSSSSLFNDAFSATQTI
jgi:hypothetical protein